MEKNRKIEFVRVIASEGVSNIEALKENRARETHPFLFPTFTLRKGGYIVLDFGREYIGRLHVFFGATERGGQIHIRLGESVAETCLELGESNAGNDHSLRDNVYNVSTWGDLSTSESGFRFVRIDCVSEVSVSIISVSLEPNENDFSVIGSFECSDDKLNQIYKTAERTLSLCVRSDDVWDGIKRDRVFWMGDFYPELLGSYLLYGNIAPLKKCLAKARYFTDSWINLIPSYSAWWIICLEKYYSLTLDASFLKEMLPLVEKTIGEFSKIVLPNGDISYEGSSLSYFPGNEFFIDWPTNLTPDAEIGFRYLLVYMLQRAKTIYRLFKKDLVPLDALLEKLDRYAYRASSFKQVMALGVLAGKIAKEDAIEAIKYGGSEGMTCFMSFAIVEALRLLGEGDYALGLINEYYGAMLELGATTFFEDFDIAWIKDNPLPLDALPTKGRKNIHADYGRFCYQGLRHSLCHGWSSGFIDIFFSYVLGVIPLEPGFKKIKIDPHLGSLEFTRGKMPTPFGTIEIEIRKKDGRYEKNVVTPEGIEVVEEEK